MASLLTASRLGIAAVAEPTQVELRQNATEEDFQVVIRLAYRQVFGNAHLMDGDRLTVAESQLRRGEITVRDFVRALGQSETYRQKFFYSNSQNRFVELNFKHFLGRAPQSQSEISEHIQLYAQGGYEAEINSYLDSTEYQANFGDAIVPYYVGFQSKANQTMAGFTRIFQLYGGYSNSDRTQADGKQSKLVREIAWNTASAIHADQNGAAIPGTTGGSRGQLYRVEVIQGPKTGPMARIRRSQMEYLVSYEQLSRKLQQINLMGGKVTKIVAA